jgi:hypothetical protein
MYIVILCSPSGMPLPLITYSDNNVYNMATFDNYEDASLAGESNPFGQSYGFQVYEFN